MRITAAAVLLWGALALTAGSALAQEGDKSVEASFNYGTESFDDLGGQIGVSVGFGYEVKQNLQARADVSYFRSSTNKMEMNLAGTRVPIDLGARYYYPLTRIDPELTAYGQGGLEISYDDWKPSAERSSRSRGAVGAVIGAGAEYALDRQFGALLQIQYHIIEDSYFSTGIGMVYHF